MKSCDKQTSVAVGSFQFLLLQPVILVLSIGFQDKLFRLGLRFATQTLSFAQPGFSPVLCGL